MTITHVFHHQQVKCLKLKMITIVQRYQTHSPLATCGKWPFKCGEWLDIHGLMSQNWAALNKFWDKMSNFQFNTHFSPINLKSLKKRVGPGCRFFEISMIFAIIGWT